MWTFNDCANSCSTDGEFVIDNTCQSKDDVTTNPALWDAKFTFSPL